MELTYFKVNKQLLQPLLGPRRRILFRPMPVVHIGRIGSLLNNPAWITLSPLGHFAAAAAAWITYWGVYCIKVSLAIAFTCPGCRQCLIRDRFK